MSRPCEVSEQMLLKANYVFCQLAVTATLWLQRAVVLMSGFSQSAFTVTVLHHAWHRQIFAIALGHSSVENLRHPQKHVNMWDPVFQQRRTSRNSPQIYMKTHEVPSERVGWTCCSPYSWSISMTSLKSMLRESACLLESVQSKKEHKKKIA